MKRVFSLSLVAFALFGAQFGRLSTEVASSWTATQDGSTIGIIKDDNTAK